MDLRRLANRPHAHPGKNFRSPVRWPMRKRSPAHRDGSFLVAFEGRHRIWRYDAAAATFASTPTPDRRFRLSYRARRATAGIEGLTSLPDGSLLALTEEFANPDGSFKGWLIDGNQFRGACLFAGQRFSRHRLRRAPKRRCPRARTTLCPVWNLSARLTIVDGKTIQPGGKLSGIELLRIEQPLVVENFEGLAVQQTRQGHDDLSGLRRQLQPVSTNSLVAVFLANASLTAPQ